MLIERARDAVAIAGACTCGYDLKRIQIALLDSIARFLLYFFWFVIFPNGVFDFAYQPYIRNVYKRYVQLTCRVADKKNLHAELLLKKNYMQSMVG